MLTMATIQSVVTVGSWVVRVREPSTIGIHPAIMLIHGLTGDENSMWIFSPRLPEVYSLIALRAPYPSPLGGYTWVESKGLGFPSQEEFLPAINNLDSLLNQTNFPRVDFDQLHLLGFSQGAALCFSFALSRPERVKSLAGLSGFVPDGARVTKPESLSGKRIFLAHGINDDMVPVYRSRDAATLFEHAGAEVSYCEDDIGHKLSAGCFRGLEDFFEEGLS